MNLFNDEAALLMEERIQRLHAGSQRKWGKMNVVEMMAHCNATFQFYFEERKVKRIWWSYFFGWWAKKKVLEKKRFMKNLPTAPEFKIADEKEFETERAVLIKNVRRFAANNQFNTTSAHPYFGKLSKKEWGELAFKHLDHHLYQFGV